MFIVIIFMIMIDVSQQYGDITDKKFTPAYSYMVVKNGRAPVCYDDRMPIVLNIRAKSKIGCVVKCSTKTNNSLRGVNYVQTTGSCSCVPKANIRYNVTAVGSMAASAGCRGYFIHDCPENFDYVIEQHKCYKMQYEHQNWYDGRFTCNSISLSHPITIDDDVENGVSLQYVNYTTPNLQVCPVVNINYAYGFFTSGIRTYVNGVRTPFLWMPYPGVNKTVQSTAAWHTGEPNSLHDNTDYCIQNILYGYFGWDDQNCAFNQCVLCEFDMSV
ncbi:hypothetical protein HELRODRAFT_179230 [Helobdella robusta]|uniref:C-type lectin domain-containing protein n=1 Tax=Helobdella robusta TaxID=6412 RepID=T1FEE2_HELRO|nr:hypothetical protein HELRODRAFT_179230 [Helobdella robusta]ESN95462.1 hypothetical protein HELRODRAFT_179230 [Helobdella robusta]